MSALIPPMRLIIVLLLLALTTLVSAGKFNVQSRRSEGNVLVRNKVSDHRYQLDSSSRQYSFDTCATDSECDSPRQCYNSDVEPCNGASDCRCASLTSLTCLSSFDCLPMDRCVSIDSNSLCYSCQLSFNSNATLIDDGNCESGDKHSFELCTQDSECAPPRTCYNEDTELCDAATDTTCSCISTDNLLCTGSTDCLPGDVCSTFEGVDNPACVSCILDLDSDNGTAIDGGNCDSSRDPNTTQNPSQTELPQPSASQDSVESSPASATLSPLPQPPAASSPNPDDSQTGASTTPKPGGSPIAGPRVCIAVDALEQLPSSALVYATHRRASVLCDQHENCATPGHMVLFNKVAMSMNDYCARRNVSCVKRVKLVNSPKMKMGLRIPSKSKSLQFTALAAARETWLETTILKVVLRLGA